MPSSSVLHVRAVTREGRPVKDAQILLWRIIPAGAPKPLPGIWSTSESGELRARLPLPSELLTVARENQTPLRFLVLAWHPQAGWAWSVVRQNALQNMNLTLTSAGQCTWTVQNCFGEPAKGLKGRIVQLRIPEIATPVPLPQMPEAVLQTNAEGKLTVGLPEGSTAYWAWGGELPAGMRWRFHEPVPLSVGEQRVRYHLGTREVRGRLVDARTHQPLRGEAVLLRTQPGKWFKCLPTDYLALTDAQGRFTAYLLPGPTGPVVPTLCRFSSGVELWASLIPPDARPPVQTACERWDLGEVALNAPDAFIVGEVRGPNGKPVPFALVVGQQKQPNAQARFAEVACKVTTCTGVRKTLRQRVHSGEAFACAFADARGRFRLPVRAGDWCLRAHPVHLPNEPAPVSPPSLPCEIPSVSVGTQWTTTRVGAGQTAKVQLSLSTGMPVRPIRV